MEKAKYKEGQVVPERCQLCQSLQDNVLYWGGSIKYAHKECEKIGNNYLELTLGWWLLQIKTSKLAEQKEEEVPVKTF